jgi:hypothetical protein
MPPIVNHKLREDGEIKAIAIVGELTKNQEQQYYRAIMPVYLGSVVHPDFINTNGAIKALWQCGTGNNIYMPATTKLSSQPYGHCILATNE